MRHRLLKRRVVEWSGWGFELDPLLLFGPGPGQRLGERRDGEIGWRGAIEQSRHDPGGQEGERHQPPDVPFGHVFAPRNGAGISAVRQVADSPARLSDRGQQSLTSGRLHRRIVGRHVDNAVDAGWNRACPCNCDCRTGVVVGHDAVR